jgi:hypothetical protein
MSYASVDDVAVRLMRALTNAERQAAAEFLDDLEADVLARLPDILDGTDPARMRRLLAVEATAVARLIRNPEGRKQVQSSIDDYSQSYTVDSSTSSGSWELSEAEWARLEPTAAAVDGSAFSIVLSYEY